MNVQTDKIQQIGVFALKQMVGGLILYVYMQFRCWACKKGRYLALAILTVTSSQLTIVFQRVFSRPYFPAFGLNTEEYGLNAKYRSGFSPNTGKYGPEKTSYADIFHAVKNLRYRQSMDSDAIVLNFLKELDCTDCSMRVLQGLNF